MLTCLAVILVSSTAKQVNITTQDHTQLTGSLIAANNPTLAKALTDPSLTLEQKQQLAKELVSGVRLAPLISVSCVLLRLILAAVRLALLCLVCWLLLVLES